MHQLKKYSVLLYISLSLLCGNSRGQSAVLQIDTSILSSPAFYTAGITGTFYFPVFSSREYIIERGPAEGDTLLINTNNALLKKGLGYKSYETYSNLAAAIWRAGKNNTAKKMFLLIEQSKELYYTGTQFHSAGNTYEYGSYTSNFKNEACLYLCKIYIEEKKYKEALAFLIKADKKYPVQYNCGTGAKRYARELNELYVICYEGLGLTNKVIELYLKEDFYHEDHFTALLKKKYPLFEIKRLLQLAVDNITVVKDDWVTEEFMQCEDSEEDSLTTRYTNGNGYTVLFGRRVQLPRPRLNNGESISRKHYIDAFKHSSFYCTLMGIQKKEDSPDEESSFNLFNKENNTVQLLTSQAPTQISAGPQW